MAQIDPNQIQWDAPATPVGEPVTGNPTAPVRGGVILTDKSKQNAERRAQEAAQRAQQAEQRAQAAEARAEFKFNKENQVVDTPGDRSLTGDEYLATLDPNLAAQVRALSEGRRAFPTGTALKDPKVQELIAAATQYDPALDATNSATRVQTRKDFTSGVTARNITAINTALGHLGTLKERADELDNTWQPQWNTVGNMLLSMGGDPRVKNFTIARDAVANELMRVFRGSGGSLTEIEEWKKNIDSSDSPEQLNGAIRQGVELLNSRLLALSDQYERGMGHSKDPMTFLNPHAKEVYESLTGGGQEGNVRLKVATGDTFSTEQDKEIARKLQEAWNGGASPDDINKLSQELTGKPLSEEGMQTLRDNEGGTVNFQPESSGTREGGGISGGITGDLGSIAAGMVRGYTANMAEEIAPLLGVDSEEMQAAIDAYAEKNPIAEFGGEILGGVLSPINKLGKGRVAADVLYGGLYGAGEGEPGTGLGARATDATIGAGTALATRLGLNRLTRGKEPLNIDEALPGGRAPDAAAVPQAVTDEEMQQISQLARQAVSVGPGTASAKRELATLAKTNPAAKEAADRLGIELPPDVLSDNVQLQSLTGMARSQVGSSAEADWLRKSAEVAQRADDALAELGATSDLAQLSDDTFKRLDDAQEALRRQADELRTGVNDQINVRDRVEASSLKSTLSDLINDYGSLAEAKAAMTPEEKKLLAMLGEGDEAIQPTYARLDQMRAQIGRALEKNEGPWADAPKANLKRYYAALAEDQLAHIEAVGGKELADQMRASNTLFSQMYAGREDMQAIFGKGLEKSLAPLLNRAVLKASKGDAQEIRTVLSKVPADMRGPIFASGLLSQATSRSGRGGFSFANFAKTYRGLRENGPVYAEFAKAVGPEGDRLMSDLYAISRRMNDAENRVLKTGKSNQALLALNAERLTTKLFKSALTRTAGTMAGAATGGFAGAGLAHAAMEMLERGGASNSDKLHKLLQSKEFRGLIDDLGSEGEEGAVNRLAASSAFARFAKGLPIPQSVRDKQAWIKSAMTISAVSALPEPPEVKVQ